MKIMPRWDTDGDVVLVVTDPRIIELRDTRVPTYLAIVPTKAETAVMSVSAIREAYIKSLTPAQTGLITNWSITMRDIQMMIRSMPGPNKERILPEPVINVLLSMADKAREMLGADVLEDEEDIQCCQHVADMATLKYVISDPEQHKLWGKVINRACESLMCLYRRLQEVAIGSAKSGIRVDESKYEWAKVDVRASWHKPTYKRTYDSWSPLGRLFDHVKLCWANIKKAAVDGHEPIAPLLAVDVTSHGTAYKEIRDIRSEFGAKINLLHRENPGKDCHDEEKELYEIYTSITTSWVVRNKLSLEVAAALVYRASYDKGATNDPTKDIKGFTFMWSCFGEEIVAALQHLSTEPGTSLIRVALKSEFASYIIEPGLVVVSEKNVYIGTVKVGRCAVDNGEYELRTDKNGQPYLVVIKEALQKELPDMRLTDRPLEIIGMERHKLVLDNGEDWILNKARIKALIKDANGLCRAVSGVGYKGMSTVYIEVYFRKNWVRVGNVPTVTRKEEDAGFWSMALVDRQFRVRVSPNDKPNQTLLVTLTDIL